MRTFADKKYFTNPMMLKVGGSVLASREETLLTAQGVKLFGRPVVSFGTGPLDSDWRHIKKEGRHILDHKNYVEVLNHLQGINSSQFKSVLRELNAKFLTVQDVTTIPTLQQIGIVDPMSFSVELEKAEFQFLGGDVRAIVYAKSLGLHHVVKISNSPAFKDIFLSKRLSPGTYSSRDCAAEDFPFLDVGCLKAINQSGICMTIVLSDELEDFVNGKETNYVHIAA